MHKNSALGEEVTDMRRQLRLAKQTEQELAKRNWVYQNTIKTLVRGQNWPCLFLLSTLRSSLACRHMYGDSEQESGLCLGTTQSSCWWGDPACWYGDPDERPLRSQARPGLLPGHTPTRPYLCSHLPACVNYLGPPCICSWCA